MSVSRWKIVAMPVVLLGVASPMISGCEALGGIAGAAGIENPDCSAEFEAGDFAKLKADAGLKGFLDASAQFNKVVVKLEADLIASCKELGEALKVDAASLDAKPEGGKGAEKVCGAVAAKISGVLKASGKATISLEITAPKCYADVEVMTACFGECGSPIQPGELKASCEGGEISGKCEGKCEGSCAVEAGAECKGTCSATCEGKCEASFSGTCGGNCDGKCDGKNAKGKCAGKCEGKCDAQAKGQCGGTCDGKCDASCEVKGSASCKGECRGGCDVEMKAPKCSGEFKPPKVSIDCQAKCAAKGAASLTCDPPAIKVVAKGELNTDLNELVGALQAKLPNIVKIQLGSAKSLGTAAVGLVTQLKGAVSGAASAGLKAAGCMAMAVESTVSASASIEVNVSASASVGGAAEGKASGGGEAKAGG